MDECCRTPRRRRAMAEDERRRQIADAAAYAFAETGYWAATMDHIARRAGMSKRTLYQLFSSKADIVDLMLRDFHDPFHVPFDTDGRSQREVLTAGLTRLVAAALAEPQIEITRVLIAEAARPGDIADAIERLGLCRGDSALEQWLGAQTHLGRLPIEDPKELAASIFWAACGDSVFKMLLRVETRPSDAVIARRVEAVVARYFDDGTSAS